MVGEFLCEGACSRLRLQRTMILNLGYARD